MPVLETEHRQAQMRRGTILPILDQQVVTQMYVPLAVQPDVRELDVDIVAAGESSAGEQVDVVLAFPVEYQTGAAACLFACRDHVRDLAILDLVEVELEFVPGFLSCRVDPRLWRTLNLLELGRIRGTGSLGTR